MSGSGVGVTAGEAMRQNILTPPSGEGGRLPHAAVAGLDEEQVKGRTDRPRFAEAQE
jgi:hypothetical protein